MLTETTGGTTATYTYDGNGNLRTKTAGGVTTAAYTWDWNNHLLSASISGSTTYYAYDGDGTRISKTQSGIKTKYINDVALPLVQVLAETNNSGTIQAGYAYGQGLISMNKNGEDVYYHYDGLGSTRQLTDSTGALAASYTYDSFGNSVVSVPSVANTYGFTGQQQFAEADNLVFLRARYYDPRIGRFISRDPILAPIRIGSFVGWILPYSNLPYRPQTLNPYVYVRNNPVNMVDMSGLIPGLPPIPGYDPPGWPGNPGSMDDFKKCWADCADTLTGGLIPRICGSALSLGGLAAKVAGATTIAEILAIVPTWMGGVAVGCAIGCGLII